MEQTRIFKLLKGYRDRPAADLDAIADTLVRLSQLVIDCPAVRELDINPLLADKNGVVALDARIRIEPREADQTGPNPRLAIRPYPNQWETSVEDGGRRRHLHQADQADRRASLSGLHRKASLRKIFASAFSPPRRSSPTNSSPASRRSTMPAPWPSSR